MAEVKIITPILKDKLRERFAAYCRVSSDSADQLNSYAAQIAYYTDYAESHPEIDFAGIYADEGLTGTKTEQREEFLRMMQDCRDGKIDRILVKSISRFSRNTVDCLTALRELKTLGVTVFFEKEALDTANEDTEIMLTAMGCFAQEESVSISKNMKVGVRMRMKNGTYLLSVPPYGYKIEDRELVIIPEQAEIVKLIFRSYLNGMGRMAIAAMLNSKGISRGSGNGTWRDTTIRYILTNEKYIGDELMQKKFKTDSLPYKLIRNNGQYEQYYYSDCHEAIISRDVFEKVQEMLKDRGAPARISSENAVQHRYSKLLVCKHCGAFYLRKSGKDKTKYWSCRRHDKNASECPSLRISEIELDSAFIRMFNKLRSNRKVILAPTIKLMLTLKNKATSNNTEMIAIDKDLTELNDQLAVMTKLKVKGLMDSDSYIEQTTEITNRVNSLRSKRRLFLNKTDGDECISELKRLSSILEKSSEMTDIDSDILRSIVRSITLSDSDKIIFKLLGGLTITEHIRRS